jgi:serine/threonine-protein kinase RsbW
MSDDHDPLPVPTRLREWATTLPEFAADVVADSDITRPHIYTQVPASPARLSTVRAQVTDWTRQVGFPPEQGQDIVLAADEAVSNAVEHAYPGTSGTLTLFAACNRLARVARLIVADNGLWLPPSADPGFRGRGLAMMEKLAHVFKLWHTQHGTTVLLGWSLG